MPQDRNVLILNELLKKSNASGQFEQSRLSLRIVSNSTQVLQKSIESGQSRFSVSELITFNAILKEKQPRLSLTIDSVSTQFLNKIIDSGQLNPRFNID